MTKLSQLPGVNSQPCCCPVAQQTKPQGNYEDCVINKYLKWQNSSVLKQQYVMSSWRYGCMAKSIVFVFATDLFTGHIAAVATSEAAVSLQFWWSNYVTKCKQHFGHFSLSAFVARTQALKYTLVRDLYLALWQWLMECAFGRMWQHGNRVEIIRGSLRLISESWEKQWPKTTGSVLTPSWPASLCLFLTLRIIFGYKSCTGNTGWQKARQK